ncbi:MAG TPA: L-threonylcarbamoyladenylate synthase [Phycisphaerales bacterium]|nr:L-threonylcarbamoyladenylate synthase [Phycisphaerales bacterium]
MSTTIPDISAAIDRLRAGGVVAFPTETVYGLGANALSEAAVRRVYALKGRPSNNPLIVHVSGPEMAAKLVREWTPDADALARMYWPGPLTLVLPRAGGEAGKLRVPDVVTAGSGTIAVRCPDHPVALALLFGLGLPLVGPSANPSGSVSPTTASHVREAFSPEDVLVLEGGPCRTGIESTVVDLSSPRARILRPGLIGAGEIAAVMGRPVEERGAVVGPDGPMPSPGMLARHYAPRTPARLFEAHELTDLLRRVHGRAIVIALERLAVASPHELVLMPDDAQDYAHLLYATLREADARGAAVILIQRPPHSLGVWGAVLDRLVRATAT